MPGIGFPQTIKNFDHNSNEEDPSNNCMPAGIPRGGIPSYIGQFPNHVIFIYPGQDGLIATQTMYRMIPTIPTWCSPFHPV